MANEMFHVLEKETKEHIGQKYNIKNNFTSSYFKPINLLYTFNYILFSYFTVSDERSIMKFI